ncbi:6-O-methylguanine DNA methyltransferase [Tuber brumale]|nr:6-O-methylguanine DNA methyltransferase [Tuber brumale]
MPRSDEATAFFVAVYAAVQEIPYGKVTSYGHIAHLIGKREQVGQALKHLPTDPANTFHHGNVPWQRVIAASGVIPRRDNPSGAARHAQALRGEGVVVTTTGGGGELHVDLSGEHGWFPNVLPSKGGGGGDSVNEETMFPVLF